MCERVLADGFGMHVLGVMHGDIDKCVNFFNRTGEGYLMMCWIGGMFMYIHPWR